MVDSPKVCISTGAEPIKPTPLNPINPIPIRALSRASSPTSPGQVRPFRLRVAFRSVGLGWGCRFCVARLRVADLLFSGVRRFTPPEKGLEFRGLSLLSAGSSHCGGAFVLPFWCQATGWSSKSFKHKVCRHTKTRPNPKP